MADGHQHFNDGSEPGPSSSNMNMNINLGNIVNVAAGPIRRRRFSTAKIQPTRIKKVMQSDEDIGRMVASVPVAIGRAMEHFAEKFLQASAQATQMSNSRTLTPAHMKQAMMANSHFHFLRPIFNEISAPGNMAEFEANAARTQMQINMNSSASMPFGGMPCGSGGTSAPGTPMMSPAPSPSTAYPPQGMMTPGGSMIHPGPEFMTPPHVNLHAPIGPGQGIPLNGNIAPNMMGYNHMMHPLMMPNHQQMASNQPMMNSPLFSPPPVPLPFVPLPQSATAEAIYAATKSRNNKRAAAADLPEGERPKRGRPRKTKKEDKCLDDDLCQEVTGSIEKEDKDRELMPPPALPMGFGRSRPVA